MAQPDELMQLWQQVASGEPDPKEVARLAGKATMTRFDKAIFWRNFSEYAAGALVLGFAAWQFVRGEQRLQSAVWFACVTFVMVYLWWKHRDLKDPDPAADARTYQAAMLARVDRQIELLGSVRYWYLLPLYIPMVWTFVITWERSPSAAIVGCVIGTSAYVFLGWLNEKVGVQRLKAAREKIEGLYKEDA
jgi:hypothetical protein